MQQTQVRTLGQEDPLEKELATHSNILTWEIPWTEEPGGLQPMGSQRVGHDWATNTEHSAVPEPWAAAVTDLQHPLSSGWGEALCAPGNLVEQVFR